MSGVMEEPEDQVVRIQRDEAEERESDHMAAEMQQRPQFPSQRRPPDLDGRKQQSQHHHREHRDQRCGDQRPIARAPERGRDAGTLAQGGR